MASIENSLKYESDCLRFHPDVLFNAIDGKRKQSMATERTST